ncbi:MAG: cytochrome c family protein [Rhodobacteraceae bacterium]|nr:cytochrome c family protein [Paracoccaceae bacterium]
MRRFLMKHFVTASYLAGVASCLLVAVPGTGLTSAKAGEAETIAELQKDGQKIFARCRSCHRVGPTARNLVGPSLNGIVDNTAGSSEGFRYSPAMIAKVEAEGLVWSEENLDAFLRKPKEFLPKTRMQFAGLRSEEDRAAIIAYLKSFDAEGNQTE